MKVQGHIAIHEAGHLMAAWHCQSVYRIHFVQALTDPKVSYEYYDTGSSADLWGRLVITLSGITAELWANKTAQSGTSREDLMMAVGFAEQLAKTCNPKKAFPINTTDRESITRMFARTFPPDVEHLLEAAYLKARTIVIRTEPKMYRVVSALMTGATLDETTLEGILGKRTRTMPNGGFVLPAKTPQTKSWGERALGLFLELFDWPRS